MTLAAALDDAAAAIDGLSRRTTASGVEWLAGPTLFAALSGPTAEFRLDPVVAAAALGTTRHGGVTARAGLGRLHPDRDRSVRPRSRDRLVRERGAAGGNPALRPAAGESNDPGRSTGVVVLVGAG